MKIKKKNTSTLMWIAKRLAPQAGSICLLMLVYAVLGMCGVSTALAARNAVDSAVNKDAAAVILYGVVLAAIIGLQVLLRIVNNCLTFRIGTRLENTMAENLFSDILGKEYSKISEYHTGELMNRINGDVTVIVSAVTSILPQLAYVCVKLAGIFVVLCSVDVMFASVFAVAGLLVWGASALFKGRMKALHKKVQTSNGLVRSFFQEMLGNTLVIKAFAAEKKVRNTARKLLHDNYKIKRKRMLVTTFSSTGVAFVFSAGYLYGMIWGALHIVDGAITYGTFTAILSLISQVQAPVGALSSAFPQYYAALASAERIIQLENIPDEENTSDDISPEDVYRDLDSICAENISFSYGEQEVFRDTELTLKKGEFAVISGASGIGKSTLIKLIMGVFPPTQGRIFLRMKDSETRPSDKSARPMFAYVPQGNFLLSGTIRENLCFANENPTEEQIRSALKTACCGFVDKLPDGLETRIGENGHGLSEGQVQRLAVARALLGGAPVLLLDEATSALDEATEVSLLKNLKALKEKTCVLITHKNAALEVCDKKIEIYGKKIRIAGSKGENL